jgi:hypothetical protein
LPRAKENDKQAMRAAAASSRPVPEHAHMGFVSPSMAPSNIRASERSQAIMFLIQKMAAGMMQGRSQATKFKCRRKIGGRNGSDIATTKLQRDHTSIVGLGNVGGGEEALDQPTRPFQRPKDVPSSTDVCLVGSDGHHVGDCHVPP